MQVATCSVATGMIALLRNVLSMQLGANSMSAHFGVLGDAPGSLVVQCKLCHRSVAGHNLKHVDVTQGCHRSVAGHNLKHVDGAQG